VVRPLAIALLLSGVALAQTSDYDQGVALFQTGQLDAAIPLLTRAAQEHPRDARAWKALGVAYAAQKLYELAESPFRRACELDPKLEDACYYQGRALYALDRFELSLRALERGLARDPNSWKIRLGRAQAFEALGRADDAEKEFKETLSLSRYGDPKPGIAYGLFLVRQGRFVEAPVPLEQVLKRFPQAAEAHIHLGRALLEQGELTESLPHFERAVAIEPASAQAHLLLSKAYVRAGRTVDAKPHFEAAARYAR